ncbi:hypothetical protein BLNAU_21760 [Blattamonas nauphoetae]|uniref:Uncharacterized protein n=1 Tax=Blattamonas nauphoetae TaxID=2049346 RepID=A0ABQ9WV10_9EUKA|nr:hypothetical protein BLNAU_21760 [Blattamonas nauphoetae]
MSERMVQVEKNLGEEHPFDNAQQDKAAAFLKNLGFDTFNRQLAEDLVTNLVPSSAGSPSGFVESIFTVLSSPHPTLVAAVGFLLNKLGGSYSPTVQPLFTESDLFPNLFAIDILKRMRLSKKDVVSWMRGWTGFVFSTPPARSLWLKSTVLDEQEHARLEAKAADT